MQQQLGSGKTTVLVERIINKIIKEKVDIDKMLIVTFTNAAASEMRQRISEAIYKKIEENIEDKNLQKQITLLNKANISTIHSFCLDVIKNYFYEIDVSPNFRIGDEAEIKLLKQETLEEIFDDLYETKEDSFINLVNTYSSYRDDENLKNLVLKIYNYSQSMPFPEDWIKENVEKFNLSENTNFEDTIWGKILISNFKSELKSFIETFEKIKVELEQDLELEKYYLTFEEDIKNLNALNNCNTWNEIYNGLSYFNFGKWPISRKIQSDLKDKSKNVRDDIRKQIISFRDNVFKYDSETASKDIAKMYKVLNELKEIIIKFSSSYQNNKKEKNIIDFNDIEHFALKILVQKDEENNYIPTQVAKKYKEKFVEIAIDEYQDSNLVQEYILNSISNQNNIFMVGDVKQSIYKFRQARPELFLEKYENYSLPQDDKNECKSNTKILLFKNFRSRKNIIDFTNLVFSNIMTKELGNIEYNENEYLNLGASYEETAENVAGKVELNIIDLEQEEIEEEILEKNEIEAKYVARKN